MNGFLVVCSYGMDDHPVRFFETRAEAESFCRCNDPSDGDWISLVEKVKELRQIDSSQWICNAVAEFRDGVMVAWDVINSAEDQPVHAAGTLPAE